MGRLGLRARTQVYHWGKNGANHAPFSANLCQCTCGCQHEKRRPSPVIVGLGRLFLFLLQHNRGVQEYAGAHDYTHRDVRSERLTAWCPATPIGFESRSSTHCG